MTALKKSDAINPSIPPRALIRPTTRSMHGLELKDDYAWLKNPDYPNELTDRDILGYLEQENNHFEQFLEPYQPKVQMLFDELKGRIKDEDQSVPFVRDDYAYWWEYSPGAQYRSWYRHPTDNPDQKQCILDIPALAEGKEYCSIGALAISPNAQYLAYSIDDDGSERYQIRLQDLHADRQLPTQIANTVGSIVWSQDGSGFFYLEVNEQWRPCRVKFHALEPQTPDRIVHEEQDEGFFLSIDLTQDRAFVVISSGDHVTTEAYVLDAHHPSESPMLICPRRPNHEYYIDHANGYFWIMTNDQHKNFRLAKAPTDQIQSQSWEEVIAGSQDFYFQGVTPFKNFMAIEGREKGLDVIILRDYDGQQTKIQFPESVCACSVGTNAQFDTTKLRVHYQSMVSPASVYDYDLKTHALQRLKVQEIPSGYDPEQYKTERLMAPSRDGKEIPISIVYRRDIQWDSNTPLHLYGYGAYGSGLSPSFSASRLSLLNRGFAFAIAHIRGGDEMGYHWYEEGKLNTRTNTFYDFIDAASYLVEKGYSERGSISISGGSAGGELMGAVLNLEPDLFQSAVAHVPFVDVLNTMLDDSLPLTPMEWPEWGNPIESAEVFKYIQSYSPYDNVEAKAYPPMLVTGGLNDPRVTYWEPAKWVAKLRATKTDNNPLLLKTNMGAGHAGKSGRYASLWELAEEFAFLILAAHGFQWPKT